MVSCIPIPEFFLFYDIYEYMINFKQNAYTDEDGQVCKVDCFLGQSGTASRQSDKLVCRYSKELSS